MGRRSRDAFRHLILPAIALGTIPLAIIARMTRSSLLDVLGLDYVRTARAKGLAERLVVLPARACRNALLPVVTIIGLQLGALLSGAVLTETIFNLTGVGPDAVRGDHGARLRRDPGLHAGHRDRIYVVVNLLVDCQLRAPRPAGPAVMMQSTAGAAESDSQRRRQPRRAASLWRDTLRRASSGSARAVVGLIILARARRDRRLRRPIADRIRPEQGRSSARAGATARGRRRASTSSAARPTRRSTSSGLDGNVRDVFSRVVYGARVSLPIGLRHRRLRDRHRVAHRRDRRVRRRAGPTTCSCG